MFLPKTTVVEDDKDFAVSVLKQVADTVSTLGAIFDTPTDANGTITILWSKDAAGKLTISSSYDDGKEFSPAETKAFNKALVAGDREKMQEIIRRNLFSKTLVLS